MSDIYTENLELKQKNEELIAELDALKNKIKTSYSNHPSKNKNYYEKNKDALLEKQRKKYHEKKVQEKLLNEKKD